MFETVILLAERDEAEVTIGSWHVNFFTLFYETFLFEAVSNKVFEMVDAIASHKQRVALDLYYDLLTLKEPPMRILALIGRQFNLLLQVKELRKKGYSAQVISEKTGLHGFVVGKYAKQAERFKTRELREALEACVEADEGVKTGKMNDVMSQELNLTSDYVKRCSCTDV